MKTIDTLKDEHNGVLFVLDQLERAVAAAERGAAVPADLFADIQEFFAVFVDRCHHGKEEAELFPRLTAEPARALVDALEAEHVAGRRLAFAAREYSAFLRAHIDLENRELLPATEALAAQDDELFDAFERVEVERIGAGVHERLHGMIEGLPARIDRWAA